MANWIANNWRSTAGHAQGNLNINVRTIDMVWRTRKEECEEELKTILGVEQLDRSDPKYFQQRLKAARIVLESLSAKEREELDGEVSKIKEKGYGTELQQQYVRCRQI